MNPDLDYHLGELRVARTANDPRRAMPVIPQGCARVLDVGCGAGQTLLASDLKGARAFGVDYDEAPLRSGRAMASHIEFVRASGESLPFAPDSFDFVISRVALPYMLIPIAVAEVARVLKTGGEIWFTLHPPGMKFSNEESIKGWKPKVYELYRQFNTSLLHFGLGQIRYPLNRSRTESYQTERGMRRLLDLCGFDSVHIWRDTHFVITARKS